MTLGPTANACITWRDVKNHDKDPAQDRKLCTSVVEHFLLARRTGKSIQLGGRILLIKTHLRSGAWSDAIRLSGRDETLWVSERLVVYAMVPASSNRRWRTPLPTMVLPGRLDRLD